ncbi:MAG: DUF2461 domain-containing protein [Bacteroidota bacterium]
MDKNTIIFLENLKKNNNRDWFLENKSTYENAKNDFIELVATVIKELSKSDKSIAGIEPKSCVFRINRDVRFAKDKSPYKTNFGASINKNGKKSFSAGYYIQIEPSNSFIGGGIYMPPADVLNKIRQEIDYNGIDFKKIILNKNFTQTYGALEDFDKLVNPPKGYHKTNDNIELLKLKSYIATKTLSKKEILDPNAGKAIAKDLTVLIPLFTFLNTALD